MTSRRPSALPSSASDRRQASRKRESLTQLILPRQFRWQPATVLIAGVLALASVGARNVEAHQVRRHAGKLASGTRWETDYFRIESGRPGPTVMLIAGMHGDEPAPPDAAMAVANWPIEHGKLVVVPRASRPALGAGRRLAPKSKYPNLNRNFPAQPDKEPRGPIARAIWELIESERPEWLIDLHEGSGFHRAGDKSVGSSIIRSKDDEVHRIAGLMVEAVNATIDAEDRHFDLLGPPVAGSVTRAAKRRLDVHSMILETSVPQPREVRVGQHLKMVGVLLQELGMTGASPEMVASNDVARDDANQSAAE